MGSESHGFTTTGVQTDADEDTRAASVLSWPSSYRSSRVLTPDTQRLLDSQLGDATPSGTQRTQLKLPHIYNDVIEEEKTGYRSPMSRNRNLNSEAKSVSSSDSAHFRSVRCSKYSVIGNPSLAKRHKEPPPAHWPKGNRKTRPGLSQKWKHSNNEFDNNTIYSTKQQKYYDKVSNRTPVLLPPIEVSQRSSSQNKADAANIKEKEIVMKNFFLTGKMKRFEEDKAVLPTVYRNLLNDSGKKRMYVNTLYNHQLERRREPSGADCTKRKHMPDQQCEFCDVMGNRYCSYCIEFKNRHFALGYERNFMLPQLPALKKRRKHGSSHLARILINANDGLDPYKR